MITCVGCCMLDHLPGKALSYWSWWAVRALMKIFRCDWLSSNEFHLYIKNFIFFFLSILHSFSWFPLTSPSLVRVLPIKSFLIIHKRIQSKHQHIMQIWEEGKCLICRHFGKLSHQKELIIIRAEGEPNPVGKQIQFSWPGSWGADRAWSLSGCASV